METIVQKLNTNELSILRAVYESGPISRVRLAQRLRLTRATVTNNVNKLKSLNLVTIVGKGNTRAGRGRKEVLLAFNADAGFVISIHIALDYVSYGIVNLHGKILQKKITFFQQGEQPEKILDSVCQDVLVMVSGLNVSSRVVGVGVALPGIVDYKQGLVRERTAPGWQNFAVQEYIQHQLGYTVYVENDVKTLTLGEYQFGTGRDVKDLICLWLENGIGAGIMLNGLLIRGTTASAGEIGFSEFFPEASLQKSILINDQPRFWGDVLSFTNIKKSIQRGLEEGWTSILSEHATIEDFITAVKEGDPLGLYIFKLFSRIVGTVCCNLIYAFNPKVLVLSGPLFRQLPKMSDEVNRHLERAPLRTPVEAVELKTSILGEDGISVGCAALVLEKLFHNVETDVYWPVKSSA